MLYSLGLDIKKWRLNNKNGNMYMCEDLIQGNMDLKEMVELKPSLLMNYNKIKINLESYNIDKMESREQFRTDKNLWIYGIPGCGKTYYATHLYEKYYIKNQNKWWDGYNGEECVILDDLDKAEMGHYIKIWADNYSSIGEIKNGHIKLSYKIFIITSNYMPISLWPNDESMQLAICRRFKFISVQGEFPNYKPIEIPNPIENPK